MSKNEWGCEARQKLATARGALEEIASSSEGEWAAYAREAFDKTAMPGFCPEHPEGPPSYEALLGFVTWLAQHPDVGDSMTAVEREEQFQTEAKRVLAGSGEAWAERAELPAVLRPPHFGKSGGHGG